MLPDASLRASLKRLRQPALARHSCHGRLMRHLPCVKDEPMSLGECIAQLMLIGFPVAILSLINRDRR